MCDRNLGNRLDFLSRPIVLNVAGVSRVSTCWTVVLSVLFLIITPILLLMAFSQTKDFVERLEIPHDTYPEYNLYDQKLIPIMYAYINDVNEVDYSNYERYFTVRARRWNFKVTISENGVLNQTFTDDTWNGVPCSKIGSQITKYLENVEGLGAFAESYQSRGICIDMKDTANATIVGSNADSLYQVMSFEILPCQPRSDLICAPSSEVQELGFVKAVISSKLDQVNHRQSYELEAEDFHYLNPSVLQRYSYKVSDVVFGRGYEEESFAQAGLSELNIGRHREKDSVTCSNVDDGGCIPYIRYEYISSRKSLRVTRVRTGILDSIGVFGGSSYLLLCLFVFLSSCGPCRKKADERVVELFSRHAKELEKPGLKSINQASDLVQLYTLQQKVCKLDKSLQITDGQTADLTYPSKNSPESNTGEIELDEVAINEGSSKNLLRGPSKERHQLKGSIGDVALPKKRVAEHMEFKDDLTDEEKEEHRKDDNIEDGPILQSGLRKEHEGLKSLQNDRKEK